LAIVPGKNHSHECTKRRTILRRIEPEFVSSVFAWRELP
jgi:hypothetical protein